MTILTSDDNAILQQQPLLYSASVTGSTQQLRVQLENSHLLLQVMIHKRSNHDFECLKACFLRIVALFGAAAAFAVKSGESSLITIYLAALDMRRSSRHTACSGHGRAVSAVACTAAAEKSLHPLPRPTQVKPTSDSSGTKEEALFRLLSSSPGSCSTGNPDEGCDDARRSCPKLTLTWPCPLRLAKYAVPA